MDLTLNNPQQLIYHKIQPSQTYQVLPPRVRVDPGVMARKGYSTFLKAPRWAIRWFNVRTFVEGASYPSVEMQSVYSTVPADWAVSSVS